MRNTVSEVNLFQASVPILYPLKTPVFCVFRGYKMGTLVRNRLRETRT